MPYTIGSRSVLFTNPVLVVLFVALSGINCSRQTGDVRPSLQAAPRITATTTQPSGGEPIDWSDFGLVLSRVAAADSVRCDPLRASEPLIERMLARLAMNGPSTTPSRFPDPSSCTAFYINAHNLMLLAEMESVLVSRAAGRWPPTSRNAGRWTIDGAEETVFTLQAKAIGESANDWRVRMALFSGRRDGPALWPRIILGDMLDVQLDEITRAALASPRVVVIDHGLDKRLLLCEELFEIQSELVAEYERRLETRGATILNVLLEWATPFNRETLNSAVGYAVAKMPRDARLPVSTAP